MPIDDGVSKRGAIIVERHRGAKFDTSGTGPIHVYGAVNCCMGPPWNGPAGAKTDAP